MQQSSQLVWFDYEKFVNTILQNYDKQNGMLQLHIHNYVKMPMHHMGIKLVYYNNNNILWVKF